MGEYFVGSFEEYGIEIEAVDPIDIVSCYFMQQWIAIMSEEEKKPEDSGEPRTPDGILYEPIVEKKKKEPEPEPRAEDYYCGN